MKPHTIFQHQVSVANERLTEVSPKVREWAFRKVIAHPAFRNSKGIVTCGDCAHTFNYEGKSKSVICPHCGQKIIFTDSRQRTHETKRYYAVVDVVDSLQVERVFSMSVKFRKGNLPEIDDMEVCRMWLNAKGQTAVTARKQTLRSYYMDSFVKDSPIELRELRDSHMYISDCIVYPRYKVIPELKRNGLKGVFPDCHPFTLMKSLLKDPRIETMIKAGDRRAVEYFLYNAAKLNQCWDSYKIATRHGYRIEDLSLWCDTISALSTCGKDIRNIKYICPLDLKAEHDRWLRKVRLIRERELQQEQLKRAKGSEADFISRKSCYFGIVITDNDIEVSVLDSIDAYKREGDAMHHCVFSNQYYNHVDSIVLSAHDKDGNRIETVEFFCHRTRLYRAEESTTRTRNITTV